jgi:aryl-alcohol dehydrogenase-like predicted oxidoreductase
LLNPSAGFAVPDGFVGHDFKLLIEKASEKETGVAVIRVLAGGVLGGTNARQGYATPRLGSVLVEGADYAADEERTMKLQFLLSSKIQSLPQAGIRFALMNQAVSTVLVGFSNLNQIEEAASCSEERPFPRKWIEQLKDLWATDFGRRRSIDQSR